MRAVFAWISVVFGVLCLAGCSRKEGREAGGLLTSRDALSTVMTRTYGFESLTDWAPYSSTPSLALSDTHTEGLKSLAVSGGGWSSIISRALSKEEAGPDVVGFDLRIPTFQPNPSWYGTVELFVDIPSRGVNNQPLGTLLLTAWTPGQWRRAEFNVPGWIKTAMNASSYADLKWRIQLNVPTNSTGQYLFDKLSFSATPPACTPQSDDNPCTTDTCDANGQQLHTPLPAGTSCSDGNACNGAETCNAAGTCVGGTPVVCTASDQCHDAGTCNPSTGACTDPAKPNGSACNDGNACTQTDTCASGSCVGENAVVCVASDACHDAGTCNTATGVCSNPQKPDGTSCADTTVCNGPETCSAGTCIAGTAPPVDDGNPCTADACDPVAGVTHTPVATGTSCSNGNACDGAETCNATGQCVAGTPVVCVATDQCHDAGTCNPSTGACTDPVKPNGSACNDGNACTQTDTCTSGSCVGGNAVVCVASDACHDAGTCNTATGVCSNPQKPEGTSCADATVCNGPETCSAGTCVAGTPIDPDDENPCTADACDPIAGVTHTPVAAGTACSDANACNGDEVCNAFGACLSGPAPTLDDENPCTLDACDPSLGVTHTPAPAGTSCANGTVCDGAETCDSAGSCQAGTPPVLDDGNPCTVDSCDAVAGVVHAPAIAGSSCADDDVCNGTETCNGASSCTAGTPLVVDDQNPCTTDTCDPATGAVHSPTAAGTSCADADACNGVEACDGAGACVPGSPLDLDDQNPCTADACDPSGGVTHTPLPAGASCNDANACNGSETCDGAGSCAPGTPPPVSDDNACTDDTCDPATGVTHTPRPAGSSCNDFDLCNGTETCDAAGTCLAGTPVPIDTSNPCSTGSCDPLTGVVTYSPAPSGTTCAIDVCTDGACNGAGECTASGPSVLDDGDPCTIEWCDPVAGPQVKTCSAIDPTIGTTLHGSMKWIYEQPNPVQTGVAPGTILVERAAALNGVVRARDGSGLTGVHIALASHPELGETVTRADGKFDMVVNGGETFTVLYDKDGYLPVERSVATTWGEYSSLPDVVMIPADPMSTAIDLDNQLDNFQVAQGSVRTDEDGTRQSTLLVPSGTQATLELSDGSTVDLASMNLRITEYTVGDTGPNAMPAGLPPETDYTHAFEVSADEAIAAGATNLRFSSPLVYYVDNYRQFPVGWLVPFGSFDRQMGLWKAEESGIVLGIVSETGGFAAVDVTGDGIADPTSALAAYGITDAELEQLATLYDPGNSLWRVRLSHATPFDCNWPIACEGCDAPKNEPLPDPVPKDPCQQAGASSIECETQVLREELPVAGTPFTLNYSSRRVPGRLAAYSIDIPVTGPTVPANLLHVSVHAAHGGRQYSLLNRYFFPEPNLTAQVQWDGLDEFGRKLQGAQNFKVTVKYTYLGCYVMPARWAVRGIQGVTCGGSVNPQVSRERTWTVPVGPFASRELGLGGWTLDVHHTYEPESRRLELGNGSPVNQVGLPRVVKQLLPRSDQGGTVAIEYFAPAPDGSIYFTSGPAIRRAPPAGPIQLVAGSGIGISGYSGNGVPASDPTVRFSSISDIQLGADGALFIADTGNHVVRKIDADGIISTIAGIGGAQGHSGDGGPATQALVSNPVSLAINSGGSIYFVESRRFIRRVDPDGIMSTVAGVAGGEQCVALPPDGSVASDVQLEPATIAIAPDGTIYAGIHSSINCGGGLNRIIKIVDGRIYHVAGEGCSSSAQTCLARRADGLDAKETSIAPSSLTFDKFGQLYFVDRGIVRTIDSENKVRTVAGRQNAPGYSIGSAATAVALGAGAIDAALCPDGNLCAYVTGQNGAILKFLSPLPAETGAAFAVASADGDTTFAFDTFGRHLSTRHPLTGSELYRFTYDASGRVSAVTDAVGLVTQIERPSGAVAATAIIAPFGQRTELVADADGYLAEVRDPEGNSTNMTYSNGLLTSLTNARGAASTMTYDADGRLELDADPAGGSHLLSRTGDSRSWVVSRTTTLGRTTSYSTEFLREGAGVSRSVTSPAGLQSTSVATPDLVAARSHADGTVTVTSGTADLRFGVMAPIDSTTTTLPSGLASVRTTSRQYAALNPLDPLDFVSITDQSVVNGRTWSNTYDKETRTFSTSSPAGRTSTRIIDLLGRTTRAQVTGLAPIAYQYDTNGHLLRTIQGTGMLARTTDYGYAPSGSSAGFLQSITDALAVPTTYARDGLGRTLTETRASNTTGFTWDELSNLESVTPPGKPTHAMTYTAVNLLESYNPPQAGLPQANTGYTYDPDRMLRTETRPDGVQIARTPDNAGRLDTVQIPGGMLDHEYYPPGTPSGAGKTSDILGPYGTNLHFEYDGMLTTSTSWSGDVTGSVAWQYNSDFNKILETVTGQSGSSFTVFGYDNDQLLTCASWTSCSGSSASSALRLTRDPQRGGLITVLAVGNTTETFGYNTFGELARQTSTFSASPIADITYDAAGVERDKLGRIVQKTEVVLGITKVYQYTYDALRRLTDVTVNGVLEDHFEYDANGNRTAGYKAGVGTWTGTYDDQDRLLTYGPYAYTYTANGELETKTNTSTGEEWLFQYDALGNLLSVGLPTGDLVEYLVDGKGRRVGKKKNGVLLKQWVYRDALKPVAELDGAGSLVAQFAYGSKSNVPDYVRRGGATYRVISDHLGSPRYVVNVSDASDVPYRAEYSSFGEMTGTGLDWMPFGFAGGLYDTETTLMRFGARDYDPIAARWSTKDPILFVGSINVYAYSDGDPVNRIDPDGLAPKDKTFGLPKKFWDWYHRKVKERGDPDLSKEEADDMHKQWKDEGEPGPDNKGPWEDFLDFIIPFQLLLDPCTVLPGTCTCDKET
jgi:RHS repeat-associated protein